SACGGDNECASGNCVDGFCCDRACGGQCEACDIAGNVGTCSAATGAPHGARGACASDGTLCGGSCDGIHPASCTYPGDSTSCRAPSCTAGTATLAEGCDGAGSGSVGTCAPVAGAPRDARTPCASDGSACGGACNGTLTTACAYPGGSTSCRNASCSSGVAVLAASCDSAGSCPSEQDVSCAP